MSLDELLNRHQKNQNKNPPQPNLLIVTCMDSRLSPEKIFGLDYGESFVIRTPAAMITSEVKASVQIAVELMKVEHVIYMPHQDCKAIESANQGVRSSHSELTQCLSQLKIMDLEQFAKEGIQTLKNSVQVENQTEFHALIYDPINDEIKKV